MKRLIFLSLIFAACQKEPAFVGSWQDAAGRLYYINNMLCIQTPDVAPAWNCYNYRMNDNAVDVNFATPETWTLDFNGSDDVTIYAQSPDTSYTLILNRIQ